MFQCVRPPQERLAQASSRDQFRQTFQVLRGRGEQKLVAVAPQPEAGVIGSDKPKGGHACYGFLHGKNCDAIVRRGVPTEAERGTAIGFTFERQFERQNVIDPLCCLDLPRPVQMIAILRESDGPFASVEEISFGGSDATDCGRGDRFPNR